MVYVSEVDGMKYDLKQIINNYDRKEESIGQRTLGKRHCVWDIKFSNCT